MKKTIAALALVSVLGIPNGIKAKEHTLLDKVKEYVTDGKIDEKYFKYHYVTIPNNTTENIFYHRDYDLDGKKLNAQYPLIRSHPIPYNDTNMAIAITTKPKYYNYEDESWNDFAMDGINGNEELDTEEPKKEKKKELKVNGTYI